MFCPRIEPEQVSSYGPAVMVTEMNRIDPPQYCPAFFALPCEQIEDFGFTGVDVQRQGGKAIHASGCPEEIVFSAIGHPLQHRNGNWMGRWNFNVRNSGSAVLRPAYSGKGEGPEET